MDRFRLGRRAGLAGLDARRLVPVARRIRILLGPWTPAASTRARGRSGREKLSGKKLAAMPRDAHVLLASPARNNGQRILRRGYSYTGGIDGLAPVPARA